MTFEELLECSAEQLEKMTLEEKTEHLKKYLPQTRPDMVIKPAANNKNKTATTTRKPNSKDLVNEILRQHGFNFKV